MQQLTPSTPPQQPAKLHNLWNRARSSINFMAVGAFLDNHFPRLLGLAGTVLSAVIPYLDSKPPDGHISWFWAAVGSSVAGQLWAWRREPLISRLQEENARLKKDLSAIDNVLPDIFHAVLCQLATNLKLTNSERISLYVFVVIGRFAWNPEYQKRGRTCYPDNQGCIGRAWAEKEAFIEIAANAKNDRESYNRESMTHGVPEEVAKSLAMASQSYYGRTLFNSLSKPIAVIIVESTEAGKLKQELLSKKVAEKEGELARLLLATASIWPKPSAEQRLLQTQPPGTI